MVFAFLVNSVPGYAAEGIDSLPVAGTVSIDNAETDESHTDSGRRHPISA